MSRKKIVIVTEGYPYWPGENFLTGEIEFLSRKFDICLLPLVLPKRAELRVLPDGVRVLKPVLHRNYILRLLQGTFNCSPVLPFIKDFFCIFKDKKGTIRNNFVRWASTTVNSRALITCSCLRALKKEPESSIYLYWCNYPTQLFSSFPNKVFARVHGTEFAKVRSNYVPMEKFKLSSAPNTHYIPISNQAAKILATQSSLRYSINRLGVFENRSQHDLQMSLKITVVSVAYLIPKKRIELIVRALRLIKGIHVDWIHFGNGPMSDQIAAEVKTLPEHINVELRGFVSNDNILQFYRENYVDLFINVSEIEGVPVSIMEALSFGIPVFATDVGGTGELVNNWNGKIVSPDFNVIELSEFITDVRRLSSEKNLRDNAIAAWRQFSDANKNYQELANIFNG